MSDLLFGSAAAAACWITLAQLVSLDRRGEFPPHEMVDGCRAWRRAVLAEWLASRGRPLWKKPRYGGRPAKVPAS